VLPRLDGDGKGRVVLFLYEAGLIYNEDPVLDLSQPLKFLGPTRTQLSKADLREANLDRAYLQGAYLRSADLRGASLNAAAGITNVELKQVKTLEGATMPDGQRYED
jgi:uncharacterized protein YjbI with pentapeptide repeats